MHAKYCYGIYPCQTEIYFASSGIWKRILDIRGLAELFICWKLNDGSCNFWYDNWLGSGAFYLKVAVQGDMGFQNVMGNKDWDSSLLYQVFPPNIVNRILETDAPVRNIPDVMFWAQSPSGRFILSSAF